MDKAKNKADQAKRRAEMLAEKTMSSFIQKVAPQAAEPILLYGPFPMPPAYCSEREWEQSKKQEVLSHAEEFQEWREKRLLVGAEKVRETVMVTDPEAGVEKQVAVGADLGRFVPKQQDFSKWQSERIQKVDKVKEKEIEELNKKAEKQYKMFKKRPELLEKAKQSIQGLQDKIVAKIENANKQRRAAALPFTPFDYDDLPTSTKAMMSKHSNYYQRKYVVPCMEVMNVIESEALDVRLSNESYEARKAWHVARGLPSDHLTPPKKKSMLSRIWNDANSLITILISTIQLISISFTMRAGWNWPYFDPSLPNLGLDLEAPPLPDPDLEALALDPNIPGLRFTSAVPGIPSIGIPDLPTVSLPTVNVPKLDVVLPYFRWSTFNFKNIGDYQAYFWTSVSIPLLFLLILSVYFSMDRFSKKPVLRNIMVGACTLLDALYLPALNFLLSPYLCRTTAVNGVTGRFVLRSLELNDPVSCDTALFPVLMLLGGMAGALMTYFGWMINIYSGGVQRPDTRYNEDSPYLFFRCRTLNFPKALAFLQKAVYAVSILFGASTPQNALYVAYVQAVFAVLTTLATALYPAYLIRFPNCYASAFSGASTWTALVALIHIGQYSPLKEPEDAFKWWLYGIGPAFAALIILALFGYWSWGVKDYKDPEKGGKPMPMFPFGIGKKWKFGGNDELGPDPEECQCGGSVGGDSGREKQPCGGFSADCFSDCCAPIVAAFVLVFVIFPRAIIDAIINFLRKLGCCKNFKGCCNGEEGGESVLPYLCFIGACCCYSTEPKDPARGSIFSKLRIQETLMWLVCCPLQFCGWMKRRVKRYYRRAPASVPRPSFMNVDLPDTPRSKPSIIKEFLWWTICFPVAVIHWRTEREAKGQEVKTWGETLFQWICCFPCSFLGHWNETKNNYSPPPNGRAGEVYPQIITKQRVVNGLYWCFACPLAWWDSAKRRYRWVKRGGCTDAGPDFDDPSVPPDTPRDKPHMVKHFLWWACCLPFAFIEWRERYGRPLALCCTDCCSWIYCFPCKWWGTWTAEKESWTPSAKAEEV